MNREFEDAANLFLFSQMQTAWNSIFEKVTGNDVSLVMDNCTFERGDKISYSISSNDFIGPKYLVTKAVSDQKNDVYAWAVPLDLKKGLRQKIALTDSNVIRLKAKFHEIMGSQ